MVGSHHVRPRSGSKELIVCTAMVEPLIAMLSQLAVWIPPKAAVTLELQYQGTDDLGSFEHSVDLFLPTQLQALKTDRRIPFVQAGKLLVRFTIVTSLWEEVVPCRNPLLASGQSLGTKENFSREVTKADGSTYDVLSSAESVKWTLEPLEESKSAEDGNSFFGFEVISGEVLLGVGVEPRRKWVPRVRRA